jgi:hypothetical protein
MCLECCAREKPTTHLFSDAVAVEQTTTFDLLSTSKRKGGRRGGKWLHTSSADLQSRVPWCQHTAELISADVVQWQSATAAGINTGKRVRGKAAGCRLETLTDRPAPVTFASRLPSYATHRGCPPHLASYPVKIGRTAHPLSVSPPVVFLCANTTQRPPALSRSSLARSTLVVFIHPRWTTHPKYHLPEFAQVFLYLLYFLYLHTYLLPLVLYPQQKQKPRAFYSATRPLHVQHSISTPPPPHSYVTVPAHHNKSL